MERPDRRNGQKAQPLHAEKGRHVRRGTMKFGPTKVVVKGDALYDAKTDKLIKDGLKTRKELEDYAAHHYITLPVMDNAGKSWQLDGKHVYCLRGSKFETLDGEAVQVRRSQDCGGRAELRVEGKGRSV